MGGGETGGGEMDDGDQTMTRIVAAVEQGRAGDTAGARDELVRLWSETGPDGDPLHRCTLGHFLADLQDDVRDELAWDERALHAAAALTDARARQFRSSLQVRGLLPSLHLNLADDHRRLGAVDRAREHLVAARASLPELPDDAYGALIRAGYEHVSDALDAGSTAPLPTNPSSGNR